MILLVVVAAATLGAGAWDYPTQSSWASPAVGGTGNQCGAAGDQSPIDLDTRSGTAYPEFFSDGTKGALDFSKSTERYAVNLVTNKYTWKVEYPSSAQRPTVGWGGKVYSLEHFHFHSPSEHLINGEFAAMEMQMMHKAPDGQSLVVAVLLDAEKDGEPHPFLKEFWSSFPNSDSDAPVVKELAGAPYKQMVPALGHMDGLMQYMGSLTNPPCTTNTVWIVMLHRAKVSDGQLSAFRAAIDRVPNNQLKIDQAFMPAGVTESVWNAQLGVNNREQQALGTRQVFFYEPGLREMVAA